MRPMNAVGRENGVVRGALAYVARATFVVCLLSASTSPSGVSGQEASDTGAPNRPGDGVTRAGWIGVSFEIIRDAEGGAEVMITDVSPRSPAQQVGIRSGDRLLAVNDLTSPEELGTLNARLRLRAGDPVTMVVSRDGDRRRLQLYAVPRPSGFVSGTDVRVSIDADSLVERWVRAIDSLRVELVREREGDRRVDPPARIRASGRSGTISTIVRRVPPDRTSTRGFFDFFVFHGGAYDSLRKELSELDRGVGELLGRIAERERELQRDLTGLDGTEVARRVERDTEMRRLRAELERRSGRSSDLQAAITEAAQITAGLDYDVSSPTAPRSEARPRPESDRTFRPLTPYLLGQNRVAGAQVVELRPELAEYFDVADGVLVVDTAPGTPAALAGIRPGDVITRIDQVSVRSVDDLRFGVSMAGAALPLTIVRQGGSLQVLLTRE